MYILFSKCRQVLSKRAKKEKEKENLQIKMSRKSCFSMAENKHAQNHAEKKKNCRFDWGIRITCRL